MLGAFSQKLAQSGQTAGVIISVALMLFLGFAMTRITKALRLPDVTAYILTGIFIGPYCLNLIPASVKSMNESVYYTVDRIHEAIARNLQVRFRYFDWGVDGRKHERPGDYFASPYALVWDDENYYLIAHSERHGLTHYRVDKMAKLTITQKPRVMTEEAKNLDLTRYGKAVFGMFSGQAQQIKLRFQNSLAGVVLDRFGKDAMLVPDGNEHFTFTTEIVVSPVFYGWLAGFGERAEILFPESVRAEFAAQCRKTLELYESSR